MFDKEKLIQYIQEEYGANPEYLWASYPEFAVFRQRSNSKWFVIAMNVTKDKLGLDDKAEVDIVNVKCQPENVGALTMIEGIRPGYHMNKKYWISIMLDGSVDENMICDLVNESYELTRAK